MFGCTRSERSFRYACKFFGIPDEEFKAAFNEDDQGQDDSQQYRNVA